MNSGHHMGAAPAGPPLDRTAWNGTVSAEAAVDTLSAISDVRFALVLRDSYGWSLPQIEAWITETAHALLLPAAGAEAR